MSGTWDMVMELLRGRKVPPLCYLTTFHISYPILCSLLLLLWTVSPIGFLFMFSQLSFDLLIYLIVPEHVTYPWSRILLWKQKGLQVIRQSPLFYGPRKFNIVFTRACKSSLSCSRLIQSTTSNPISLRPISVLSSTLAHFFQVVFFAQASPPKL